MAPGCQIMISYLASETGPASKNGDGFSAMLQDGLLAAGYTVLLSVDNLKGGNQFDSVTRASVEDCVIFVAVCSPSYAGDESLQTRREFMYAIELKKNILPIFHSGAWPPEKLGLGLAAINYVPKGRSVTTPGVTVCDVVAEAVASLHKMQVLPTATRPPATELQDGDSSEWGAVKCTEAGKALLRNHGISPASALQTTNQQVLLQAAEKGNASEVARLLKLGLDCNWRSVAGSSPYSVAASGGHLEVVKLFLAWGVNVNKGNAKTGSSALQLAANGGRTKVVQLLLESGATVDLQDETGGTALSAAAINCHADAVKLLLASGASADMQDDVGSSPYSLAASGGHLEVVKLFVARGVNVNKGNAKTGRSALQLAANGGRTKVVKLLLDSGATVDLQDKTGGTALSAAAINCHVDAVKLLLASGASADVQDENGDSPLTKAAASSCADVFKLLLAGGASVNHTTKEGNTALTQAAGIGHLDVVKLLLAGGANVNHTTKAGDTSLFKAAANGHSKVVAMLMTGGAKADMANMLGFYPMMAAGESGHIDVVKVFLKCGVKVNQTQEKDGRTSLHGAASKGQTGVVKLLLDSGAGIHASSKTGTTALFEGSCNGHFDVVKLLLARKASVGGHDETGVTALTAAASRGHTNVVKLLLASGASVDAHAEDGHSCLTAAVFGGHVEMVNLFLARGMNVNHANVKTGSSILKIAADNGKADVVQLLIASGATVDLPDKIGATALTAAATRGHTDVVKLLLASKASVESHDETGATALNAAASRGHTDLVQLLLASGASVDAHDENGDTCLTLAAFEGHIEVVKLLLARGMNVNHANVKTGQNILEIAANNGELDVVQLLKDSGATVHLPDKTPIVDAHGVLSYGSPTVSLYHHLLQDGERQPAFPTPSPQASRPPPEMFSRSDMEAYAAAALLKVKVDAQALKKAGNAAYGKNDLSTAVQLYTSAIKLDDGDVSFLTNRALAHYGMGNFQQVVVDCDAALALGREVSADINLMGKALQRKGDALSMLNRLDDALVVYQKSHSAKPNDGTLARLHDTEKLVKDRKQAATIVLANIEREKGNAAFKAAQYLTAAQYYTEALKLGPATLNPEAHKIHSNLAACHTKRKAWDDGLKEAELCIALAPGFSRGYSRKAAIQALMKDYEIAAETYKIGLSLEPDNSEMRVGLQQAVEQLERARKDDVPAKKAQVPTKLEEEEAAAIATAKVKAAALKERECGSLAYKNNDFEAAVSHYSRALELFDGDISFLINRAAVHFEMGNFDKVVADCDAAVERGRELSANHTLLGKALQRKGDALAKLDRLDDSLAVYRTSLTAHPNTDILKRVQETETEVMKRKEAADNDAIISKLEYTRGNEAHEGKRYLEAVQHYTEALKRGPPGVNPHAYKLHGNLAGCYYMLNEWSDGLEEAQRCIALSPDLACGYIRKGAILVQMKDFEKAMKTFKTGLKLEPNNKELLAGLQLAEEKLKWEELDVSDKVQDAKVISEMKSTPPQTTDAALDRRSTCSFTLARDVGSKVAPLDRVSMQAERVARPPHCSVDASNAISEVVLKLDHKLLDFVQAAGTELHKAAAAGYSQDFRMLLTAGPDLEAVDKIGGTALHKAAFFGHVKVVTALLKAGAKVDARVKSMFGMTALGLAAHKGHHLVVAELLTRHASADLMSKLDLAAIHFAAEAGHVEVVEALLDGGADGNLLELETKTTALLIAALRGHHLVVSALLKGGWAHKVNPDAVDRRTDSTALHFAALHNDIPVMTALLLKGAAATLADEMGDTALHVAATQGYVKTVEKLLEDKRVRSMVNLQCKAGWSALHRAAAHNHNGVVTALLGSGAAVDLRNPGEDGMTALHMAAQNGRGNVVRTLLDGGAKVDCLTKNWKRTPLMMAVRTNNAAATTVLMEYKADTGLSSKTKKTAMYYVGLLPVSDRHGMMKLLRPEGA